MVRTLIGEDLLHSDRVIEALRKVPREQFVPEKLQAEAYIDAPLPTGHGQTISAPHGEFRATHGGNHERGLGTSSGLDCARSRGG